jgi:uncharacterized LabA/DUF88 family protein
MIAPALVLEVTMTGGRVRIFIDFWNLSLGARDLWGPDYRLSYRRLPTILADQASTILRLQTTYEGTYLYAGVDLSSEQDKKLNKFLRNTVGHFPGYQVRIFNRKPKHPPNCPACHELITICPHCNIPVKGTVEKGVDVSIATDMFQLAVDDTYDVGIIISNDADFVPAVKFLDKRSKKIVHAGFGHQGEELAGACWAHISLDQLRAELDNSNAP